MDIGSILVMYRDGIPTVCGGLTGSGLEVVCRSERFGVSEMD